MTENHNAQATGPDRDASFRALEANVALALDRARSGGADGAEITASLQGGLNTTVRLDACSKSGRATPKP